MEEESTRQVYGLFGKYYCATCQKRFAFLKQGSDQSVILWKSIVDYEAIGNSLNEDVA